jgi:hypothetical protein
MVAQVAMVEVVTVHLVEELDSPIPSLVLQTLEVVVEEILQEAFLLLMLALAVQAL